jgi:hypothetical protein
MDKNKESWYTYTSANSDLNQLEFSNTMQALNKGAVLMDIRDYLVVRTSRSSDRQQGLSDGQEVLLV